MDPVDVEVLGQERRADHAHALLHPPHAPQLAHACIHQGEPGPPPLPRPEGTWVFVPLLTAHSTEAQRSVCTATRHRAERVKASVRSLARLSGNASPSTG